MFERLVIKENLVCIYVCGKFFYENKTAKQGNKKKKRDEFPWNALKKKRSSSFIAGNGASHYIIFLFASLIRARFRYRFTETNLKLVLTVRSSRKLELALEINRFCKLPVKVQHCIQLFALKLGWQFERQNEDTWLIHFTYVFIPLIHTCDWRRENRDISIVK